MKTILRILSLTLAIVASAATAHAAWPEDLPSPEMYVIHGYLDRAPEGTKILDRIEISADRRGHTLLVTWYGTPGETSFDQHLSRRMAKPFQIRGPEDLVKQIGAAPAGTKIEGKFEAYTNGPPWLLIAELEFPDAQHS